MRFRSFRTLQNHAPDVFTRQPNDTYVLDFCVFFLSPIPDLRDEKKILTTLRVRSWCSWACSYGYTAKEPWCYCFATAACWRVTLLQLTNATTTTTITGNSRKTEYLWQQQVRRWILLVMVSLAIQSGNHNKVLRRANFLLQQWTLGRENPKQMQPRCFLIRPNQNAWKLPCQSALERHLPASGRTPKVGHHGWLCICCEPQCIPSDMHDHNLWEHVIMY